MSTKIGGRWFPGVYPALSVQERYTLSPKSCVISEGGSLTIAHPTRRNRTPRLHELHGWTQVLIDNGQRIDDTVVTVEVDRKHAMENTMLSDLVDVNVPLGRNAKFGNMLVRVESFSETVHEHVYSYGLRQILNDAMADKTDDDGNALPTDQIVAKAQKRLDALYAGDLRVRRAGDAEPADPVEAEIARQVKIMLHEQYMKMGAYKEVPKKTTNRLLWVANHRRTTIHKLEPVDSIQAIVDEYMSKSPRAAAIRKEAERTVKMRADAGDDLI
jgi:hypothetical protein